MKIDKILEAAQQRQITPERAMKLLATAAIYQAEGMQRKRLFTVLKERTIYSLLETLRDIGLVNDVTDSWSFLATLDLEEYPFRYIIEMLYLGETALSAYPTIATELADIKATLQEITALVKPSSEGISEEEEEPNEEIAAQERRPEGS